VHTDQQRRGDQVLESSTQHTGQDPNPPSVGSGTGAGSALAPAFGCRVSGGSISRLLP